MQNFKTVTPNDSHVLRRERVNAVRRERHTTVGSYFHALAQVIPDRVATMRLLDGEGEGPRVTFAQMDHGARSLAGYLQKLGATGSCAMLLLDCGAEVVQSFLGCAYAGVIAVPMPAPLSGKVERYLSRVMGVVQDSDIRFIITTSSIVSKLRDMAAGIDGLSTVGWIVIDALHDHSASWREAASKPEDIVYLQYTSGSTSSPKGVMITHDNLMKIIDYNGVATGCDTVGTQSICWLPYFHDFGLIEGLLLPLAFGMSVHVMTPLEFVKHPVRWVNAIHKYRASHSSGPNFAFDLVARKTSPEERAKLDLSCWRRANNAAEPIRSSSLERFIETFEPFGFARAAMAPAWGLAEATLMITMATSGPRYYPLEPAALRVNDVKLVSADDEAIVMVGCGQVHPGTWDISVRVVNPDTSIACGEREIGEVWVSGEVVAMGYWNRPDDTAEKFHAHIEGEPGRRYMRSGDLAFMDGDELVFTGRRKDLIIIEGKNHYPQEIEKTAEASHPALRPGATIAFSVDTDEQPRLVVVSELSSRYCFGQPPETGLDVLPVLRRELERAIRSEVAEEHQVRVHEIVFIPSGTIPKTTSGKLQRSLCREQYESRSLAGLADA